MIRINLSTLLGKKRWTQADLARRTGIRPNTINDLYHILYQIAAMDEEKSYNLSHWDCGVHFVPFFSVGVPRFF